MEAHTVSDHDDITPGEDPADTTERRDWDLPEPDEPGGRHEPAAHHGLTDPGTEPPLDRPEPDDAAPHADAEPPDESERRDWDMP